MNTVLAAGNKMEKVGEAERAMQSFIDFIPLSQAKSCKVFILGQKHVYSDHE